MNTTADRTLPLHRPLFLDFAAEMNGDEGWGGHHPARYVGAYRHIHDIFSEQGADNVVWVWAPNNADSPHSPGALAYYPGPSYVDWTGIDKERRWQIDSSPATLKAFRRLAASSYFR